MGVSISQYRASIGLWNRRMIYSRSYNKVMSNYLNDTNIKKLIGFTIIMNFVSIGIMSFIATDQNLNMSIISMQCLKALLVISGVEQNPGPSASEGIKKDGRKETVYHEPQELYMIQKINVNQDIQEIESFIEEFADERKVDEKTDEARGNDELIRNDAQGIIHIVEKLGKDGKKYEIGDVVNALEHLRKEDKKKDEIPKVVDKVDDGNEEDRISDEMLDESIQRIQCILDKSKEEGKAYEWSKIVSTLEYLSKGRNDDSEDDDDDDVFIEEEVDKRTENKKESGSKISTEKEDKGNKNKTNKRTLKKGKRKISEIYLCAVCNKSITSTCIPCKACLNYIHLSRCTDYKDAKAAKAHE